MTLPPAVDLARITQGLMMGPDGIWYSPSVDSVSYPDQGNEWCFGIEDQSYWFVHRNQCIAALLRTFPPEGTLVDVGGGNGYVASMLQSLGMGVVLVEPGADGARNARLRGVTHVVCSSLEGAGFLDESIAAACLFDVVEHIEKEDAFLTTLNRILTPGGRVYLSVPAFNALWSIDDIAAGHFRRYSLRVLEARLQRTGYSVEYATYIFSFLPIPILLMRTLPWRFGLRRSFSLEDDRALHRLPAGLPGAILGRALQVEPALISRRRRVPWGGSCLLVARKIG